MEISSNGTPLYLCKFLFGRVGVVVAFKLEWLLLRLSRPARYKGASPARATALLFLNSWVAEADHPLHGCHLQQKVQNAQHFWLDPHLLHQSQLNYFI